DYLFGYDATADVVDDWMYEQVDEHYIFDPAIQEFLARSNPWALHAIAERLLEAAERGLWSKPAPETLDALQDALLHSEASLEGPMETAAVSCRCGNRRNIRSRPWWGRIHSSPPCCSTRLLPRSAAS